MTLKILDHRSLWNQVLKNLLYMIYRIVSVKLPNSRTVPSPPITRYFIIVVSPSSPCSNSWSYLGRSWSCTHVSSLSTDSVNWWFTFAAVHPTHSRAADFNCPISEQNSFEKTPCFLIIMLLTLDELQTFREDGIFNYTSMLIRTDLRILLAATDAMHALNLNNIRLTDRVHWKGRQN